MTQNDQTSPSRDWAKLAQDALDLWQTHLNNMANDPKMKEDMARLVAPMGDMFTQWSALMQAGMQNMQAQHSAAQAASEDRAEAASASSSDEAMATPMTDDAAPFAAKTAQDVADDVAPQDVVPSMAVAKAAETEAPDVHAASFSSPVAEQTINDLTSSLSSDVVREPDQSPARGRTASADGPRDLAQLASRLAELERELEGMRSRGGKRTGAELSTSDTADAGDVQRVAGAGTGTTSR